MVGDFDELEVRFLNGEADVIAADELRFDPATAPDVASAIDAHLEVAIGQQHTKAKVMASLIDGLLIEFWAIDATISAMRTEQRRVRVEAIKESTS